MKNQYFGDINDYKKYGILRTLAEGGSRKIALCWMLTGDDGRTDGRFTAYLKQPHRWRSFDPELFDSLRNLVLNEGRRRIELVSSARLIRGSVSFSNALSDTGRDLYFTKFRETAGNASLVFFDPDNGFEIKSVPRSHRGSHKYLYWDEATSFYLEERSLLVYQHFPRMERKKFITLKAKEIFARMETSTLFTLKTSNVVFFLIPAKNQSRHFLPLLRKIEKTWRGEIVPVEHRRTI